MQDTNRSQGYSALRARNVRIHNRRTSVKLEPAFWDVLERAVQAEGTTLNKLCSFISDHAQGYALTAAIRVFILAYAWTRNVEQAIKVVPVQKIPD